MSMIKTQLIDEVNAWRKLAKAFDRYHQTGAPSPYSRTGLSIAVSKLCLNGHITRDTELRMKRRIQRDWALAQRRMPEDHAYAKARADRCRVYEQEALGGLAADPEIQTRVRAVLAAWGTQLAQQLKL